MRIGAHQVDDGVVRVAVTGEVDVATADDLYQSITDAAESVAEVVVDLADVTFCDSSGIGALAPPLRPTASPSSSSTHGASCAAR